MSLDFVRVSQKAGPYKLVLVYPEFIGKTSEDLMIKGNAFYAVWDERNDIWSTDYYRAIELVDNEISDYMEKTGSTGEPRYLKYTSNGSIDSWNKYCKKQLDDNYHALDQKVIFQNSKSKKTDYATFKLPYSIGHGDISAYEKLISHLYSFDERQKIEWAIGSIIAGDSKKIQKFYVFYGGPGTGKSTILNIIDGMFSYYDSKTEKNFSYVTTFDAAALGQASNQFSMTPFRDNPLIAIQHDGDLSKIDSNLRLNSIVSHEDMIINEKSKSPYILRLHTTLFIGSNKPVKMTDAKTGLMRRLIDISPTGNRFEPDEYNELMSQIRFEYGAIADHCLKVYRNLGIHFYDGYTPTEMMETTNDFYNFVEYYYDDFAEAEEVHAQDAWKLYKTYCDFANVSYPYGYRQFKSELKNYFAEYKERSSKFKGVYVGFLKGKFHSKMGEKSSVDYVTDWLDLKEQHSLLDDYLENCPAQYANQDDQPTQKWVSVETMLKDLDTSKIHYVQVPSNLIVIDFDIKGPDGEKNFDLNKKAASGWPKTYAELSKGGQGIHLHYLYSGDVTKLSRVFDDNVEVKVFTGNSSLRRRLSKCNDIPIASISSGLPFKEVKKNVIDWKGLENEKMLRSFVKNCLEKKHHGATKPEVDYLYKELEEYYTSGKPYDISDLRPKVLAFANNSSHNAEYCVTLVSKMHFKSEEEFESGNEAYTSEDLVFFDIEVFPNLLIVCHKIKDHDCVVMINPLPSEVAALSKFKLIGFNCRRYDNHILYARMQGADNAQMYKMSQRIIKGSHNAMIGGAYNLSYTDVYDFLSAAHKMSLKKWEIKLDIHHQENEYAWDQPLPEEHWEEVAQYCCNDVIATEAVFEANQADWTARQILAKAAGYLCPGIKSTVNDTTNTLTGRLVFRGDKNPQSQFVYTDLSTGRSTDGTYNPMNEFKGYKFDRGKSTFMGEEIGEGGYVYAVPGVYENVGLFDIASMHPHSILALNLFGPTYTKNFAEIMDTRIAIKHQEWDKAKTMLDGALADYIHDGMTKKEAKDLSNALKTAINSVYGLTSAKFDNVFRDNRNIDNIVAKRGELFMVTLKHEVLNLGYSVAHIKTDSIKVPSYDEKIKQFVMDFGKKYGYDFEHEATFSKFALMNGSTYICRVKDGEENGAGPGQWSATGAQFQVPFVFKTLFSHEPIEFSDLCETKTVTGALYLDMNEGLPEGEHKYVFVGKAGLFCPIKDGCGGGELVRKDDAGKYSSATGAKGYRWLEAETVKTLHLEDSINKDYYRKMVDQAVNDISKYCNFEWFTSDEKPLDLYDDELPF